MRMCSLRGLSELNFLSHLESKTNLVIRMLRIQSTGRERELRIFRSEAIDLRALGALKFFSIMNIEREARVFQ